MRRKIKDVNESALWYEHGRNLVWRDSARHRYAPTENLGPHEKSDPYKPGYELPGADLKLLELAHQQRQLLLASGSKVGPWQFDAIEAELARADRGGVAHAQKNGALELRGMEECHALPRPLVDIVLSVSRLGGGAAPQWFADRALLMPWARTAVQEMIECKSMPSLAAAQAAQLFGTFLPGFFLGKLTKEQSKIFQQAWDTLLIYVDAPKFLGLLKAEIGAVETADLNSWKTCHEVRSGPHVLTSAERIRELEAKIFSLDSTLQGQLKSAVIGDVEVMKFVPARKHKIILVGDLMTFNFEGKQTTHAWWIIDRTSKPSALKVLRLKPWFAQRLVDQPTRYFELKRRVKSGYVSFGSADLTIKPTPDAAPITPGELLLTTGASRELLIPYYSGCAAGLAELRKLTRQRDKLVDELMGQSEQIHGKGTIDDGFIDDRDDNTVIYSNIQVYVCEYCGQRTSCEACYHPSCARKRDAATVALREEQRQKDEECREKSRRSMIIENLKEHSVRCFKFLEAEVTKAQRHVFWYPHEAAWCRLEWKKPLTDRFSQLRGWIIEYVIRVSETSSLAIWKSLASRLLVSYATTGTFLSMLYMHQEVNFIRASLPKSAADQNRCSSAFMIKMSVNSVKDNPFSALFSVTKEVSALVVFNSLTEVLNTIIASCPTAVLIAESTD